VLATWGEHTVDPLPEDVLAGMREVIERRRATPPPPE
jgi:hypothetical protein